MMLNISYERPIVSGVVFFFFYLTSLVQFISKYFIVFDAVVSGIVF